MVTDATKERWSDQDARDLLNDVEALAKRSKTIALLLALIGLSLLAGWLLLVLGSSEIKSEWTSVTVKSATTVTDAWLFVLFVLGLITGFRFAIVYVAAFRQYKELKDAKSLPSAEQNPPPAVDHAFSRPVSVAVNKILNTAEGLDDQVLGALLILTGGFFVLAVVTGGFGWIPFFVMLIGSLAKAIVPRPSMIENALANRRRQLKSTVRSTVTNAS